MATSSFSIKGKVALNMRGVTTGLKKAGAAGVGFSKRMVNSIKSADFSAKKLGHTLSKVAGKLRLKQFATGAFAALSLGAGLAARSFVRFDDAITASSAKFKGLNLQTKEGQQILLDLKGFQTQQGFHR